MKKENKKKENRIKSSLLFTTLTRDALVRCNKVSLGDQTVSCKVVRIHLNIANVNVRSV